jgi:hypothetical protein
MKIILLIPCVLYVLGVVDVIDGADEHLRGSNRDLQYYSFGGDNDPPLIISTQTNPTQSSSSQSFQSPDQPNLTPKDNAPVDQPNQTPEDNAPVDQPNQTPEDNAPVDQPNQTPEDNAPVDQPNQTPEDNAPVSGNTPLTSPTTPINSGFLQPTGPVEIPILGGPINVGSINSVLGKPSGNTGSGSSTKCESINTKVRSGLVCPEVVEAVICESGCQYDNSCKAEVAAKAGFPANQCRPN